MSTNQNYAYEEQQDDDVQGSSQQQQQHQHQHSAQVTTSQASSVQPSISYYYPQRSGGMYDPQTAYAAYPQLYQQMGQNYYQKDDKKPSTQAPQTTNQAASMTPTAATVAAATPSVGVVGGTGQNTGATSVAGYQYPMMNAAAAAATATGSPWMRPVVTQAPTKPRITTTFWEDENTVCYQVEARGVAVSRREDSNFINGTKLLNVTGMTRGRRDGILKTEKTRYVVKIGAMNLKGVWIPFERAFELARNEGIADSLFPLFVRDIKSFFLNGGSSANAYSPAQNMAAYGYPSGPVATSTPQGVDATSSASATGNHTGADVVNTNASGTGGNVTGENPAMYQYPYNQYYSQYYPNQQYMYYNNYQSQQPQGSVEKKEEK
ncbi:hypothetical protein DASC09_003710 [Saccharomycopsis crataegensis]|uniref:HTH APSES-type domain-containing protein n=1 Tax=Saccharomycopsis crataegensis TaxID=43959 RepID=A0AAV5QEN1_9ASCO|nr:hypothetical protein DASC09_003710 [Saccharomycopsis crataegensis]